MKTSKVIQLVFAGALAFALNGVAVAQSFHLNASATHSVATTDLSDSPFIGGPVGLHSPQPSLGNFDKGGYGDTLRVRQCPSVPEPSMYLLMLAGVGLIGFMSYRRQRYFMSTEPVLSSA